MKKREAETTKLTSFETGILSADEFVRAILFLYSGAPDDEVLSIGHWNTPEPDPDKMTINTLPRFQSGLRVTVGQLKGMKNV
jgi:hypothetical protein